MSEPLVGIESLSKDERLDLLERLWDSLSETPADVPVTRGQQAELDRREQIDAAATARVVEQHECMHDSVRSLCTDLLADRRGRPQDLDAFEACQSALVAELAHLKTAVLARSARHDPLTGLPLRYGLEEEFGRCRALAQRSTQKLVLMPADVDRFKRVNAVHGHAAGDRALRHLAGILRAQARADEPVFRFGGEEFLVIFHAVDEAAAGRAADRLVPSLAVAQDTTWIARAPNKAGGHIVITSVQGGCKSGQLAIYTATSSGSVKWGCVAAMTDNHILGQWSDGQAFAFDYGGWTVNPATSSNRGSTFSWIAH